METTLQLSRDELKILESVYGRQLNDLTGYTTNTIEKIKDLNANEKKFFAGKNFVSPHFFIQTLYKVRGNPSPLEFNSAVNNLLNDNENLRVNFCNVGTRTVKVVNPVNTMKAEIIFRNLTQTDPDDLDDVFRKVMEADMRRDFDLRHDALIRLAVYRTSDEEFAVLVTIAHLIADSFDAQKFFAKLLGVEFEVAQEKSSDNLLPKNQDAIRDYWAKVLDKAPPTAVLPYERKNSGSYRQKALRKNISADILSDLRGRAQSNRKMLTAILQSAWGFMLQLTNKRRDSLFCQILSDNKINATPTLNLIPVRVTGDNLLTVEKIVRKQFQQLVVSQPYSCFDWSDLNDLSERGKKLFDHFLSFKEFQSNELNYVDTPADERGKIIARNSWDAQGMKLGAYFRYSEKNLSISFLYDERQFSSGGVEKICNMYSIVLQQMLVDWNSKYLDFIKNLEKLVEIKLTTAESSVEDDNKKIRDFLSQLPILQGRFGGTIGLFDDWAEISTCYEGDRISGELLKKNFIFVMTGKLARNVDTGDGWYNPIDIVRKNSFINPTSILDRQRITISAEVLTEHAELLLIPHDIFIEVLRKNSEVSMSIMNYALEQMERWQMLWLQS